MFLLSLNLEWFYTQSKLSALVQLYIFKMFAINKVQMNCLTDNNTYYKDFYGNTKIDPNLTCLAFQLFNPLIRQHIYKSGLVKSSPDAKIKC